MGKKTPVNVEVKPRHRDEPIERLIKRFMKKVKNLTLFYLNLIFPIEWRNREDGENPIHYL